jgi:hypothetical protein
MSYQTLNQIFYHNDNKFDVPESIHLLEKYFYKGEMTRELLPQSVAIPSINSVSTIQEVTPPTPSTIDAISYIDTVSSVVQMQKPQPIHKKANRFSPFLTDTIFWCVFHHVYGEIEYSRIKSKYGNRMLEEKQKIMEHFQKTPKILKQTNVKMTNDRIKETLSEFMCGKNCSSFLETAAYALYYDLTIYIIDEQNRTYLHFCKIDAPSTNLCILYVSPKKNQNTKQYTLLTDNSEFDLKVLEETYVCLEQFDKPLKAQTHYKKIAELEEIAQKLSVNLDSKYKKPELYNLLAQKMAWI